MFFYDLLWYISLLSPICVLIVIYFFYLVIKSVFLKKERAFFYELTQLRTGLYGITGKFTIFALVLVLISTLATSRVAHQIVGIHNLELKSSGTYCFFVEAKRAGGTSYVLPAQIRVEPETYEYSDGKTKTYINYYIEKVCFSNGSILEIDDPEDIGINETVYYSAPNGDEWALTLLNKHAYSPYVIETNKATPLAITYLVVQLLAISFLLYTCLQKENDV